MNYGRQITEGDEQTGSTEKRERYCQHSEEEQRDSGKAGEQDKEMNRGGGIV